MIFFKNGDKLSPSYQFFLFLCENTKFETSDPKLVAVLNLNHFNVMKKENKQIKKLDFDS